MGAGHQVLNIDKLTYAGDLRTVAAVAGSPNYHFSKMDILDQSGIAASFRDFAPQAVFHLAAETHVDRSIDNLGKFIDTNVHGTFAMLQTALGYWDHLGTEERARFRFIQVSTDEVYGSLGDQGFFTEATVYRPNSPYSASITDVNRHYLTAGDLRVTLFGRGVALARRRNAPGSV